MVNPVVVNAGSRLFRRRIFTNLFAFSVEFYDSKIPVLWRKRQKGL